MGQRFHSEVEAQLRDAGWEPGRTSSTVVTWASALRQREGDMPDAARRILAEFGGLTVGTGGAGQDHARATIQFDPTLALGEAEALSVEAGERLYPLGHLDGGHFVGFVGPNGAVWSFGVDEVLRQVGLTADDAFDRLLLGKRARHQLPYRPRGDIGAR